MTDASVPNAPPPADSPPWEGYDEVLDVRSPAEFAQDHVPGALNLPVLDDAERARVGTLYVQTGGFEAKRLGAALVARNIGRHLEETLAGRPKRWRPLVYCWRGGSRSGAMAHVLKSIGWRAEALPGGYKTYRYQVIARLQTLPAAYHYRVLCGLTGSGKSRLLTALAEAGAQVLDLEGLAAHRGSVLGGLPGEPQPGQKLFESRLLAALLRLNSARPVFVESESKKIGNLQAPQALLDAMWASPCVRLETAPAARVRLLKEDYAHFLHTPALLDRQLACLTARHGQARVTAWRAQVRHGDWDAVVAELLAAHYDPAYEQSIGRHYPRHPDALPLRLERADANELRQAARGLVDRCLRG